MSKRSAIVSAEACVALAAREHRLDAYANRELSLGSLTISRALPIREHRLVGPWCFLDRFGPLTFTTASRWTWPRTRTSACRP